MVKINYKNNIMKTLLFEPSLYTSDEDIDFFGVDVFSDFWETENLKEKYIFALEDKITLILEISKLSYDNLLLLLQDKWHLGNEAIQIVNDKYRHIASYLMDTCLVSNLIDDFVKRLEIIKSKQSLEKYYTEKGLDTSKNLGITEKPTEPLNYIDFDYFSMLFYEMT